MGSFFYDIHCNSLFYKGLSSDESADSKCLFQALFGHCSILEFMAKDINFVSINNLEGVKIPITTITRLLFDKGLEMKKIRNNGNFEDTIFDTYSLEEFGRDINIRFAKIHQDDDFVFAITNDVLSISDDGETYIDKLGFSNVKKFCDENDIFFYVRAIGW